MHLGLNYQHLGFSWILYKMVEQQKPNYKHIVRIVNVDIPGDILYPLRSY